jgi:hypothetical protein
MRDRNFGSLNLDIFISFSSKNAAGLKITEGHWNVRCTRSIERHNYFPICRLVCELFAGSGPLAKF